MPTALVTRANSFIGSHMVRELVERGYTVRGFVRPDADLSLLEGLPVALYAGDLRDALALDAATEEVEYVFHVSGAMRALTAEAMMAANVEGTRTLLDVVAAQHERMPIRRFLFVSCYTAVGPGIDVTPIDETHNTEPVSWHGRSVRRAEDLVRRYAAQLPVTIARPGIVYGEGMKDFEQTFGFVTKRVQVRPGTQKKHQSMVYVRDVVRGMAHAAEQEVTKGETYFLAHPTVHTSVEVVQALAEAMDKRRGLGVPLPIWLVRMAAWVKEFRYQFTGRPTALTQDRVREITPRYRAISVTKAQRDFGWEARLSLLDGWKRTVPYVEAARARIRYLQGEKGTVLWLKYLCIALLLGTLIELVAFSAGYYQYRPWWLIFPVVILGYGLGLGTLAKWLRKRHIVLHLINTRLTIGPTVIQFLVGTLVVGGLEVLNALGWLPGFGWAFAPGWPFGIDHLWWRSAVLGVSGGVFLVLVNAIMRFFYRWKLARRR